MDWTKAKTILIIALLATNLFLIYTYVIRDADEKIGIKESVLLEVLADNDIYIECEIPKKSNKMAGLTIEYESMDSNAIQDIVEAQMYRTTESADIDEYITTSERFLNEAGIYSEHMYYEKASIAGKKVTVKFKCMYEDVPVETSYVSLKYKEGILIEVDNHWFTPVKEGKKKKRTISAFEALTIFMSENQEEGEIVINNMQLIYWLDDRSNMGDKLVTDTAIPTWKITWNNKGTTYINGYGQ